MNPILDPERGRVQITGIKAMQLQKHPQTLIKVETDVGLVGYGEAGTHGPIVRAHLEKEILPLLKGQDPLEVELHYERMTTLQHPNMPNIPTISGVDIALWDLAGKILDRPVSKLLTGRYREKVKLYTNTAPDNRSDKGACHEWVQRLKKDPHGWKIVKVGFPLGEGVQVGKPSRMLLPSEIRQIGQGFDNISEALGDAFDFIVHCHNEWDLPTAINACQVLASCQPMWIEDPLPVPYDETWKALKAASPIRVITGEKLELPRQFYSFLANDALDAIHPDIVFAGGFTGCRRIAQLAELFYIPVATHNIGSLIHTMATVHFAATVRDFVATESRIGQGVFIEEMGQHDLNIADGYIQVPDRPGLGVELVEEVLKANLAQGEPYWN